MIRAGDALDRLRSLPILPFESAFADETVAILAPHPDDESLGCGGLIAECCDRRRPPLIIVLTDGTGSHPNSRLYPAERLRAVREAETRAAMRHLGLDDDRLHFLGYRDTAAPNEGPPLDRAASLVAQIVRDAGCHTLLAPWRHDPHCDHEAAARIAAAAGRIARLRLLDYPVWGLTLPPETMLPDEAISGFRIDITHQLNRKRAAIHAHGSQYAGLIPDDPSGFQMHPGFIDMFLRHTEIFIAPASPTGASA